MFGHKAVMVALIALPVLALAGAWAFVTFGGETKESHYIAGRELHQQGRFQEAIAEYDEAIRLNPESVKALTRRGDALYAQGDFAQVLQDYDQSINLRSKLLLLMGSPEYPSQQKAVADAYIGRALVHTVTGHDMEAQRNLAQVTGMGIDPIQARAAIEELKAKRCKSQEKQSRSPC